MAKHTLIVMRAAEMHLVHPLTDFSRHCSKCGEEVGIYPSGQSVLHRYGEADVEIVCSRCVGPGLMFVEPAPGALKETKESIANPRRQ